MENALTKLHPFMIATIAAENAVVVIDKLARKDNVFVKSTTILLFLIAVVPFFSHCSGPSVNIKLFKCDMDRHNSTILRPRVMVPNKGTGELKGIDGIEVADIIYPIFLCLN
jgi:hypothetical protein